ncbi:hypothetical protein BGZ52_006026 [Haplosporangium bisporale]|nr:hypothetical protein BGZ52_006026 [Haplosporangium bisporale]
MPYQHPSGQTSGQNQTFDDNRPNKGRDGGDQHSDYQYSAKNSFTVATVFIAMLTITALIVCFRLKSRLRTFACFATSLSLSTAILGLLTAYKEVVPIWYYAWNVIAESVGVIALNLTIVNVGNGFYPMMGKKHCYWKLSIMIIATYGVLGLVNVGMYIPQMVKWMKMKNQLSVEYSRSYCVDEKYLFNLDLQALDLCLRATSGAVFLLPSPAFLVRFYKRHFTRPEPPPPSPNPLAKTHYRLRRDNHPRRRGSFSDLDDDDDDEDNNNRGRCNYIHNTPSRLSPDGSQIEIIQYSVERFQSPSSEAYTIVQPPSLVPRSYNPIIGSLNTGNKHASQGSNLSRLRIFPARVRGSSTESSKVFNLDFEDMDDIEKEPSGEPSSFLPERVPEKTMNVDPENDEDPTLHPADIMRDYVTEYYYFPHPSRAHLQQKDGYQDNGLGNDIPLKEKDPLSDAITVAAPQKPEPALLTPDQSTRTTPIVLSSKQTESIPAIDKPEDIKSREDSMDITGTTGWEIGGWLGHVAERSVSPTNLSHSLETSPESPPLSPQSATSFGSARISPRQSRQFLSPSPTLGRPSYDRDGTPRHVSRNKPSKDNFRDDDDLDPDYTITPPLQELTGLQKQLAESRSALFPIVMAMAEQDRNDGYDVYALAPPTLMSSKDYSARVDFEPDPPRPSADVQVQTGSTTSDTLLSLFGSVGRSGLQPANEEHATDASYRLPTAIPVARPVAKMSSPSKSDPPSSTVQAPTKKSWLMGRKDPALQYMSKKTDSQLSYVPESSGSGSNGSNGSNGHTITNTNINTNNAKASTDPSTKVRENKPKEGRLAALSKALTGGSSKGASNQVSGQRHGRPSQDVTSGDQGDGSSSYGGDSLTSSAITAVPTVQDLALASASAEDDNDKGLQYYFPDPYSQLAEFRRPPPLNLSGATGMERSSSSQLRHPLSPTFDSSKSDATRNSTGANIYGGVASSDTSSVRPGEDASTDGASIRSSTKSTKLGQPKKSLLRDTRASGNIDLDTNYPANQHHSNPLGSLLSRSASGSKKLSSKIMSGRGTRSKSDVVPDRPSIEQSRIISSPLAELPITVTRKPEPILALPHPAQTSLSPPPRQTWARSKSFQGTTAAISAALMARNNHSLELPNKLALTEMSINTAPSNGEEDDEDVPLSPSSSTASSRSPPLSPISPHGSSIANLAPRVLGSKISRLGPHIHSRNHSLGSSSSNEGRMSLPSSPTSPAFAKDRLGFSTAAMDLRRASSRHQRSVDNLTSSYYYKRAAELSQAVPPPPPSIPLPIPPTSPLANRGSGGYCYYNAPSGENSSDSSVRNSPSNPNGPGLSSTSLSGSPPTSYFTSGKTLTSPLVTSGSVGAGMNVPSGYGPSLVDPFPRSGSGLGGSAMRPSMSSDSRQGASGGGGGGGGGTPSGESERTSSISSVQLKDDPWTQAMVARATLQSSWSGPRVG